MKKTYAVAPGVEWVNGSPVPKGRRVELTAEEAAFDLAYARISIDEAATAKTADKAG